MRPIPGYDSYLADSHGGIWSVRGRILRKLKPATLKNGYLAVVLWSENKTHKTQYVHRLVLLAFVGAPKDGEECLHLDDCKTNNSLANLTWGTRSKNYWLSVAHGRDGPSNCPERWERGELRHNAKLTEATVREIRKLCIHNRVKQRDVAALVGVSQHTVWGVVNNRTWKHVSQ